jgi:hypothetical protein
VRDTGGFSAVRDTGGFGAVRDTGGFGAARDTGGLGAVRGQPERAEPRTQRLALPPAGSPGYEFEESRRPAPDGPREFRYTPTVAGRGPGFPPGQPATGAAEWLGDPEDDAFPGDDMGWPVHAPDAGGRRGGEPGYEFSPSGRGKARLDGGASRRPPGRAFSLAAARSFTFRQSQRETRAEGDARGKGLGAEILASLKLRGWALRVGLPILSMIAVGIAVVVVVGANSGNAGPAPSSLSLGFPPATSAEADFAGDRALLGRGISQTLGRVASDGTEIVATGSQSGARISRAQFFVSENAGRSWHLGTVQAAGGGEPAPGHGAVLVAGGPNGWVALGPDSVWTSPNGEAWTLTSATGLPEAAGDKVNALVRTGNGFLAAGENVPGGNATAAAPVIWLSANGSTWQRLGGARLSLPAGTGQALGITFAAANGNVIVMSARVSSGGVGVWRSVDGGTTWTAVRVPTGGGARNSIAGLAVLRSGFMALRPAVIGGDTGAAVYTSADGATWRRSAVLAAADGAPLTVGMVSGGPNGAVVTAEADGFLFAFLSPNGVKWNGTFPFAAAGAEKVSGVALSSTGFAVTAGTSADNSSLRRPLLTLIGTKGGPAHVNITGIAGAVDPELAVNAIAADGATQVAVGSADGFPAIWTSRDGGTSWTRAAGRTPAVLSRAGVQQLTGVTHGDAGWLAVGGVIAAAAEHPVVITSADGGTWAAADREPAFARAGLFTVQAAAGRSGYVIVGRQVRGGHTTAAAWWSTGLTGWRRVGSANALSGAESRQMDAVTAVGAGFAAVGSDGASPAAWLSPNGRTWSMMTLPVPGSAVRAVLQHVAAVGRTVAAIGTETTAAGAVTPFAAVSADGGATWQESALPAPSGAATVTALTAAGSGFTATGTFGAAPGHQDVVIWTLAHGTSWTAATPAGRGLAGPGIQAITALTQAGSTLTGVGFVASPTSEEPTLWQSPVRG